MCATHLHSKYKTVASSQLAQHRIKKKQKTGKCKPSLSKRKRWQGQWLRADIYFLAVARQPADIFIFIIY